MECLMKPNVLLLTHGRKHRRNNPGYSFLAENKRYCFSTAYMVDYDAKYKPTHTFDLMKNHRDVFDKRFDYIFCIYTPYWVFKSKEFWYNVEAWLAPGGIFQTIVPKCIKERDYILAYRASMLTGLRVMNKRNYMVKGCENECAIVLQKDCN